MSDVCVIPRRNHPLRSVCPRVPRRLSTVQVRRVQWDFLLGPPHPHWAQLLKRRLQRREISETPRRGKNLILLNVVLHMLRATGLLALTNSSSVRTLGVLDVDV